MTSPQDYDRLSAYLDGQLPPRERAALETRLGREPELRAALDDLRLDLRLLRALPQVKPPRSFVLSAAQARAVRRPRSATGLQVTASLRLASALAAVALVVVLVGDLGFGLGAAAPAPLAAVQPEASVPATLPAEMQAKTAAETPVLEAFAAQAASTEAPAEAPAPAEDAAAILETAPGAGERAAASAAPSATLAPEGTPEMALAAAAPAEETETPEAALAAALPAVEAATPAEAAGEAAASGVADSAEPATRCGPEGTSRCDPAVPVSTPVVRYVELALACLALGLALAAYWLRLR